MSGIIGVGSKSGVIGQTELEYERGNWSPQLKGASGGDSGAMSNLGNYVRIGHFVHLQFMLSWSSAGTFSGNIELHGLPFTVHPDSDNNQRAKGTIGTKGAGMTIGGSYLQMSLALNPGYVYCFVIQDASSGYSHTPSISSSGNVYACELDYMIA